MKKIKGLIAATYTPMLADGTLNLNLIKAYSDYLKVNGVYGAFICGTTGEGSSLTVQERMVVAETWMDRSANDFPIIVHVGHNSLEESRRLAEHAQKIGAYGISALSPNFFKLNQIDDLVAYCAQIAEKAPELPFYYYHIPVMTGASFNMLDFLQSMGNSIPNFAGIKFTHEDLMDYGLCQNYRDGKYDILFGRDEILLSALAIGAQGAVGSTYNYMAGLFNQIIGSFNSGKLDDAKQTQLEVMEYIKILIHHGGGVVAGKAIMKLVGLDCGPVRLPLKPVENVGSLKNDLESAGFFKHCSKENTVQL